jgi:cytochrome bd-type quinol oxidase subunit 2
MRTWRFLLAGMLVWTVHFFGAYILASIFPERVVVARALAAALTLACLAALIWLARRSLAAISQERDELSGWAAMLATLLSAIAIIAVLWQAFPILVVRG